MSDHLECTIMGRIGSEPTPARWWRGARQSPPAYHDAPFYSLDFGAFPNLSSTQNMED